MKKFCAILLAFWITACTAIPPPGSPNTKPSATLESTQAPSKDAFHSSARTPTAVFFTISTPTPIQTQIPIFTPTRIIPTLQPGSSVKLISIQMIDAQTGWGIQTESDEIVLRAGWPPSFWEGYIVRTTDGGKTWQNVTPPIGAYPSSGFFALDANHAWASTLWVCCTYITATHIWHTTDGGKTWQPSQPFPIEGQYMGMYYLPLHMQFIDQNTGWLSALVDQNNNNLFRTTDGGETWQAINGGVCGGMFAFISSTTGWYITRCRNEKKAGVPFNKYFKEGGWKVAHTTDGGNSFSLETVIPTPPDLQQLEFTDPDSPNLDCGENRMFAFTPDAVGIEWGCDLYQNPRKEYRYFSLTTDAGRTWNTWEPSGNEYFLNATHGWRLLSPGQLQQTLDSGLNWATIKTVAWEDAKFDFINEQEGWALVKSADTTALVHTVDGGKTWEEIKPAIASP